MNSYDRTYDDLFQETLTAWQNQFPGADTSKGSLIWMRSAVLAAARWGLHKHASFVYDQDDPFSAARPGLESWAVRYGLTLDPTESDSALLDKIVARLRTPPAGGNSNDYVTWAKEITGVVDGEVYENAQAQGLGTVDLVVWGPEGGAFVLGTPKRQEIYDYILSKRPVGMYLLRVLPVTVRQVDVTISGAGAIHGPDISLDVAAYMNSLKEGEVFYLNQVRAICVANGAPGASVDDPLTDVAPDFATHEIIRPGTIYVT